MAGSAMTTGFCHPGIEVPLRPENPEWIWKTAKAPLWVTGCVMSTQYALKQYAVVFPALQPFTYIIDPIMTPCLGSLDYCTLAYTLEDMQFGNEGMTFKGDCCTYHQALAITTFKSWFTCGCSFSCWGGKHVMPTYLDENICLTKDEATFEPGKRWEDAMKCKEHFEEVRTMVLDKGGHDDYMYVMQNVPPPPFCEACKGMCAGFGDKAEMTLNNQLRYVNIGNRQLKFTGDAAGFNALKPSCGYICTHLPCYIFHGFAGTYKTAFNQYIDNHLEWRPDGPAEVIPTVASSMGNMFGGSSTKVAPEPVGDSETGNPPGEKQ